MSNQPVRAPSSTKCYVCDSEMSNPSNLKRHLLRSHGIIIVRREISPKGEYYFNYGGYTPGENAIFASAKKVFKCYKCSAIFERKWNLERHEQYCIHKSHNCEPSKETNVINTTPCPEETPKGPFEEPYEEPFEEPVMGPAIVYNIDNIEFIKEPIGDSSLTFIKNCFPRIDRRILIDYSKRIFDIPDNRCIKKIHLRMGYTDVYVGDGKWEKSTDSIVYRALACVIANDMSSYVNERRSKLRIEVFQKVIGFIDYMTDEGYINDDDKELQKRMLREFHLFVKELKMIVYNKSVK